MPPLITTPVPFAAITRSFIMPNTSWRHHYIPQFYLKHFTNKENKFHIYLVKEERYKANGKMFSPESHFFEEHGNTLFTNNSSLDFLETEFYKKLDNDVANLFHKIHFSAKERYGLTEADMPMLQFFVAHLFWRNPINDEYVKNLIKRKGLTGLGIQIKDKETNKVLLNTEAEKRMMENEHMHKLIKFWLPLLLFKTALDNNSPLTISSFIPGNLPSLICDNPLILRNPQNFDVYKDDFILPLSRDKILVRTKKIRQYKENTVRLLIDLLLVKQANKFISTSDLRYINMLNALETKKSIEEIRNDIFSALVEE
jgi:hypothetical protein